jgi:hypothetical protein
MAGFFVVLWLALYPDRRADVTPAQLRHKRRTRAEAVPLGVVRVPDYIAIGVLVVLTAWAVADWIPRGKL